MRITIVDLPDTFVCLTCGQRSKGQILRNSFPDVRDGDLVLHDNCQRYMKIVPDGYVIATPDEVRQWEASYGQRVLERGLP